MSPIVTTMSAPAGRGRRVKAPGAITLAWDQNRPSGWALQDETNFSLAADLPDGGDSYSGGNSAGGFTDATAPYSPDKVAQFILLSGTRPGGSLGQRGKTLGAGTLGIYTVCNFKFSSNYTVHPINQKLVYAFNTTGQTVGSWVFGIRPGSGETNYTSGVMRWTFDTQRGAQSFVYQNVSGPAAPVRDQWYKVEILTGMNTVAGTSDGTLKIWINDELAFDRTDMLYVDTGETVEWRNISLNVYYGGNSPGHTVPSDCALYVDHWSAYAATSRP